MFAQGKESRISRYVFLQRLPNSSVLIFLSELNILRIVDNCVCTFNSVSLCSMPTTDIMHSIKFESFENALRATLPVEVVPHLGSG